MKRRRRRSEDERPTELEQLRGLAEASARKAEENERRMDHIVELIRAQGSNG